MSASAKEREQFVAQLTRTLPDKSPAFIAMIARRIMRAAATHGRLAEESCNGHPAQGSPTMDAKRISSLQTHWDARIEREERRIEALIARHATALGVVADFQYDPHGYTVKLHLPNEACNTLGGKESGYGVPQ